ncbi:hypothetical protein LAZ67_19002681 [Cordylochernes scorpioides]|uniref:Uncharacterized protein n=1 Tax=Cordylochernes scorpioides TaxID=51811 RepID=A0ABY6LNJ4_9ARAC|nr:hypothetical protein LAZ67_19002681 [Cordylochernes scorpioides]
MSQNYNCVAPEPFNFSNPGDWPKWIRRFERFRQASGLINNPENEQVNMLVYCMGDNADDILLSCKIASDQLENYDKVIECFESHFIPRRNIIYERARFNQRCQQEGEKVNEFITALHSLAEHCNFGMLHDELIRDRIVVGVRDRALSERMQLDTDLTLVKATLMAKQLESVKEQQSSLYQQDSIDQIKKMPNHIKETKRHEPKIRQFKSNQLGGSSHGCTRCGNSNNHDWKNCPAMNSYCSKCKKKGHYAKVCRSEAINEIKSEIAFLGSVEDNSKKWIVPIKVNNRQINFKIDTGADVNVLPLQYYYQSFQRIKLEKSDKILQGPNGIPLETVGMIHQFSSGGRGGQRGRLGSGDNRGCYNCGEEGHRKFECTKPARGGGRGRGQSRGGGSNNTSYNCGEVGHRKYECTNNMAEDGGQEENQRKSKKACYTCGEFGHKKDDCPKSGTQESGDEEESSDNEEKETPQKRKQAEDSEEEEVEAEEPPKKKSKKPKSKKKEEDCYLTLQAHRTMPLESARSREMRRPPLRHQPGSQGDARMTRSKRPRRIALHQRPHLQEMEGCRGTTKTRIQRRASLQCQPCIQDMEGQSRYLEGSCKVKGGDGQRYRGGLGQEAPRSRAKGSAEGWGKRCRVLESKYRGGLGHEVPRSRAKGSAEGWGKRCRVLESKYRGGLGQEVPRSRAKCTAEGWGKRCRGGLGQKVPRKNRAQMGSVCLFFNLNVQNPTHALISAALGLSQFCKAAAIAGHKNMRGAITPLVSHISEFPVHGYCSGSGLTTPYFALQDTPLTYNSKAQLTRNERDDVRLGAPNDQGHNTKQYYGTRSLFEFPWADVISIFHNLHRDLEFFGGYSEEDPAEWLEELELLARQQRWPEDVMLAYARSYLKGPAKKWAKLNTPQIFSNWTTFKKTLMQDFKIADTTKFKLIMELQNRVQGYNESTLRYAEDVLNLCNKVNSKMSAEDKLYYMKTGLNKYLSLVVLMTPCSTVKEFLELARRIDQHLVDFEQRRSCRQRSNPIQPFQTRKYNYNNYRGSARPSNEKPQISNERPTDYGRQNIIPSKFEGKRIIETRAGTSGVNLRNSPPPQQNRNNEQRSTRPNTYYRRQYQVDKRICWNCSEQGHISRYCPYKPQHQNYNIRPIRRQYTRSIDEPNSPHEEYLKNCRGIEDREREDPDFDIHSEEDFPTLGKNKTIRIVIKGMPIEGLIDTGAMVSCIDEELVKNLELKFIPDKNLKLKSADNQKLNAIGKSRVKFKINKKEYEIEMIILKKCNPVIILGDDFLSQNKALINCQNNTLWVESPNIFDQNESNLRYAHIAEDKIIPEYCLCLVKGYSMTSITGREQCHNSENGRQQATFNLFGTFVGHFNFFKTEYRTGKKDVRAYLDQNLSGQWIGRRGPIEFPARSPDLTPLDFFLWGTVKDGVYKRKPRNLDILWNEIQAVCREISLDVLIRCTESVVTRTQNCIDAAGLDFNSIPDPEGLFITSMTTAGVDVCSAMPDVMCSGLAGEF